MPLLTRFFFLGGPSPFAGGVVPGVTAGEYMDILVEVCLMVLWPKDKAI